MKTDDRYSATVWADEQAYIDYADYRNFVANLIQEKLSKELITALCTKGSIVAIMGDSTTRKDESTCGIYCRQDIYVKELVRCKDCKWYRNRFNQHYCCQAAIDCPLPDDYCSRSERKDEADNG